jgi:hypothetical protein
MFAVETGGSLALEPVLADAVLVIDAARGSIAKAGLGRMFGGLDFFVLFLEVACTGGVAGRVAGRTVGLFL